MKFVPAIAWLALGLGPVFFPSPTLLSFGTTALIIAVAAQGWNILGGFAGQLSFGHAAFFGIGAYTTALLQIRFGLNAWLAGILAITAGAVIGFVIGSMVFRAGLRGSYFALVTLAFAEVFRILANALPYTGGAAGLLIPLDPQFLTAQFESRLGFFYFALISAGLCTVLVGIVARRRFGAQLVAVREDEDAAAALGVNTMSTKLRAITLSAAVTAWAGVLFAQHNLFINADLVFGTALSVEAILATIVGGAATSLGPIVGAFALQGLGEITRTISGPIPGVEGVLFGALLVVAIAFAPRGILGLTRR